MKDIDRILEKANEKKETIDGITYLVNPTKNDMQGLINQTGELRGILSSAEDVYLWRASDITHSDFQKKLGIIGQFFVIGKDDNVIFISGKTKDITMFLVSSKKLKALGPFRIMSRFF